MSAPRQPSPRALPRGPHGLSAEEVAAAQRVRLLHAITDVVSDKGYAAATVADVIDRAGVSRKTFYEQFTNKEDCFVAAFDYGAALLSEAIVAASGRVQGPLERLAAGYQALCDALAQMPSFARAFALVATEAGSTASARRNAWREVSIERLRRLYADTPKGGLDLPGELPDVVARAVVGAVDALVTHHVETFGAASLPVLAPTLVGVARALMFQPIAGPERTSPMMDR